MEKQQDSMHLWRYRCMPVQMAVQLHKWKGNWRPTIYNKLKHLMKIILLGTNHTQFVSNWCRQGSNLYRTTVSTETMTKHVDVDTDINSSPRPTVPLFIYPDPAYFARKNQDLSPQNIINSDLTILEFDRLFNYILYIVLPVCYCFISRTVLKSFNQTGLLRTRQEAYKLWWFLHSPH